MSEILYDVFISHAYEDKNEFANQLALTLKKKGLKVWYSGTELKVGDSIAESVNLALKNSKFGIVIISPVYLNKQWAMSELKALFSQETEQNRILPILHRITVQEIKKCLPVLADRYSISSEKSMQVIVNHVMRAVKGKRKYTKRNPEAKKKSRRKKNTAKSAARISGAGFITLGGDVNISGGQVAGRDITNKSEKS